MSLRALIDRWFVEVYEKGNRAVVYEMVAPECRVHGLPAVLRGPEGFMPFLDLLLPAFRSVSIVVEDSLEVGDRPPDRSLSPEIRGDAASELGRLRTERRGHADSVSKSENEGYGDNEEHGDLEEQVACVRCGGASLTPRWHTGFTPRVLPL